MKDEDSMACWDENDVILVFLSMVAKWFIAGSCFMLHILE